MDYTIVSEIDKLRINNILIKIAETVFGFCYFIILIRLIYV